MNINVRVISAAARAQIKSLQAQVAALEGQVARANSAAASPTGIGGSKSRKSMMAWGNQIQWTGRQLQYNWTLPIVLAGAAATKFALDNEKAFTRVKKVYGDTDDAVAWFRKNQQAIPEGMTAVQAAAEAEKNELEALERAFVALSNRYGVVQKEVLETAGAWAAAGQSGAALAKSTELSIRASVLGEMDLAKATESLIAIQAQYSLSTKELGNTLDTLNAIENQTGISMQGLIDGFARSAGVAREAGVDVRHLGAMLAALVPASGTAANAGNSLKTIISRLLAPTGDAAKLMREFGVDTRDAAWQSSTAVERLTILARHMDGTLQKTGESTEDVADNMYALSDSQKSVVASTLGSRYQMNRFLVLMREMAPSTTYYEKALNATADSTKTAALAQKELDDVLKSSPHRLKTMWVVLQNGLADAIQPAIPFIIYLSQAIGGLIQKFNDLDPAVQKLALVMLVALAAVGPVVRYFGSLATLLGAMAVPLKALVGWWVKFATVEKVVDGVTKTTRRSLVGMIASLVAAPFVKIANGFGVIIGAVWRLGLYIAALPKVTAAASAGMSAVTASFAAVWAGLGTLVIAGWRRTMQFVVLTHSLGMATMVRNWLVGLALMVKSSAAWGIAARVALAGPIVGLGRLVAAAQAMMYGMVVAVQGGIMAISVLFSRQMFLPLIMGFANLSRAVGYVWTATWVSMNYIMLTGYYKLLAAFATFRTLFLSGWTGFYMAKAAIATGAYNLLIRLYVAFSMGLTAAMSATARLGTIIWAAMHAAFAVISTAFWSRFIGIWIAGFRAIPLLLTRMGGLLRTIWAAILGAWRTGTLKALARFAGPWAALFTTIVSFVVAFRSQIAQVWNNLVSYFADSSNEMTSAVISAWNSLPSAVTNALVAVARVVQTAALQIYEWFSYINPFARHSPSLVENVTEGMDIVGKQFAKASTTIGGHVRGAYADIKAFGNAVRGIMGGAASFEQARDRASIKKFSPGALDEFDRLAARLNSLKGILEGLKGAVDRQQAVVDKWSKSIDRANKKIDEQQKKLDRLTKTQTKWETKLQSAEDRLANFASAPIRGMGKMSDKIFENEQAQKRLRLEMMKIEDAGGGLDDIRSKIEAINGAQESLRGERAALRSAGAGSEILGSYDAQIAALEETKKQQEDAAGAVANLSRELDILGRKGDMLDLENSLKFDPLTRQIEKAANATKELSFDRIMNGIKAANVDIDKYREKFDAATVAVNNQQAVIDKLISGRDRMQERLDREVEKLDQVKKAYDRVNDAIGDIESTMQGAVQATETLARAADEAAEKAKKAKAAGAVSPAVQNFRDAAGGNFAQVGGAGIPIRTNWKDQSGEIDKLAEEWANMASEAMGAINPFAPIKDKWNQFKSWMSTQWSNLSSGAKDMWSAATEGLGMGSGGGMSDMIDKFRTAWAKTKDWFTKDILDPLKKVWDLFWPSIKEIAVNAWDGLVNIFGDVGEELVAIFKEIGQMGPAFKGLWNILKPFLAVLGGAIALIIKLTLNVLAKTIKPIFDFIGDGIAGLLRILRGAIQIISGFFMLFNPGHFQEGMKKMLAGVGNILGGTWDIIWSLFKNGAKLVFGIFWGLVDGIIDAAMWLWDVMVGHSIIPDLIEGILFWFHKLVDLVKWLWSNVVTPIWSIFTKLFNLVLGAVKLWWGGITLAWNVLKALSTWLWDNVLSPIINKVIELWDSWVKPALGMWWTGVQNTWAALRGAAAWMWENVLKPVFEKIKALWNDFVKPAFKLWWRGIVNIWSALKALGKWMWDNVLKPIFNRVKELWDKFVKPAIQRWWTGIVNIWNVLKALGKWFWDNVLKPVFERVKDLWTDVKSRLASWWENIKSVWGKLLNLGSWFYNNVMKPVITAVKDAWTEIKEWLNSNKDKILAPMKSIANGIIKAVNAITGGLNKVAKVLPGVDWNIGKIDELAAGGPIKRRANRGFKTNGARAIVGEGKANYPEFVIPTDPTYRNRARGLLAMAASKIGTGPAQTAIKNVGHGNDVPHYKIGGWLGDIWDGGKNLGGKVKDQIGNLKDKAVGKIMDPLLNWGRDKIKGIGWKPVESPPLFAINKLEDWVKGTDQSVKQGIKQYSVPAGGSVSVPAPSNPGGRSTWKGGTFSNKFIAHMQKAEQIAGASIHVTQGGFRPRTSYSGTSHQGDALDMQVHTGLIRALRAVGVAAGDRTGLGNWSPHVHAIPGPGAGYAAGSGPWQFQDYMARGGAAQPLNSAWGLKSGGIALAKHGPTLVAAGDGRYDEAVVPLPKGWRNGGGLIGPSSESKAIHFHGDLVFPNVENGEDAKAFIDNLASLAED